MGYFYTKTLPRILQKAGLDKDVREADLGEAPPLSRLKAEISSPSTPSTFCSVILCL